MSSSYGTPIRIHFDNAEKMAAVGYKGGMELNATSIAMSVERSVGGMPMPFTGGRRYGIDLNRVNSTIIITGIFTDDDRNRASGTSVAASAQIDFGVKMKDILFGALQVRVRKVSNDDLANLVGSVSLYTKDNTLRTVRFLSSSGSVGHISGLDIRVTDSSTSTNISPENLATAFKAALDTLSDFTTTVGASDYVVDAPDTKVSIIQNTKGRMNSDTNIFFVNNNEYSPYHENFSGGYNDGTKAKSAGDKVQDLYGILHNTQRAGSGLIGGGALAAGAIAGIIATGGAAAVPIGIALGAGGVSGGLLALASDGDYPIGIQIPYNSIIQAPDGQRYTARNFFIPTGLHHTVEDKTSDNNSVAAGTLFDKSDKFTGIRGTIQKFDVGYAAGEELYNFEMVFAPIDVIV